jgi:hypothetical protein
MALNPSGAISLAGPSAGQSIAVELGVSATATISLNDTNVRTLAGVASGVIVMPTNFWGKSNFTGTQKAIFGYGSGIAPPVYSVTNLVSSTGVVASDTPGVGTARTQLGAATYGGDKAIFGYGLNPDASPSAATRLSMTNLVSNTGVVSSDTPGIGPNRFRVGAVGYGSDKALFAFGATPGSSNAINLVSNTGVVASATSAAPATSRMYVAGSTYGGDKAIFGYGSTPTASSTVYSITNLVSNTGVFTADIAGVGTARTELASASYGGDKAIFGYGVSVPTTFTVYSMTNLVSNTGVVSSDTPGIGTNRYGLAAAGYGSDKAIFGFGAGGPGFLNITNLVSNTGVVSSDTPGVGSQRRSLAAAGYSTTA